MRKRIIGFSIIVLVTVSIFSLSSIVLSQIDRKKKDELYQQVELFSDALILIQNDYVDETKAKDLIYGALKGMLSSLDPHSQFMDIDTYNELKVETKGKFGGLGIEITIKDGLLTVVTPIEDTPAWKAGIKAGDHIVKINEELTRDITLIDAVKKLRGQPQTEVNLTILREGEDKLLDFKIVRDIIKIRNIKDSRILEDEIGYVRLIEFQENSSGDLESALASLEKQGMDALILDLRNNPGGLLDAAVKISEKFLEKGKLIVSTRGRRGNQNLEFMSLNKKARLDLPLVILVNGGSASGSEIVAAALQDYRRAIILGTKTFGKGSVQTIFPLSDGSAIRLTTSKYLSPNGRLIHGQGVIPDIIVQEGKIQVMAKEKAKSPTDVFEQIEKKEEKKLEQEIPEEYKIDNQLMRALDVLKAIKIYKAK